MDDGTDDGMDDKTNGWMEKTSLRPLIYKMVLERYPLSVMEI